MPEAKLIESRFGVLTTVRSDGRPHAVPIVFAIVDGRLVTAVDHKPKTTRQLVRLANIANNPAVSVLVHHDTEDWTRLWWIRIDGRASVESEPPASWVAALVAKYPQYRDVPPGGPWIAITMDHISEWSSA